MKNALFSVVILCYRHFEYLHTAIDSVLEQDYPNIELVISDDGSPNFPREEIEDYIAEHKGKNITSVCVRQQPQNSGTVKHLNSATRACTGEYIAALAGDDIFYSTKTLSKYVEAFVDAPENCFIEMAETAMYDEELEKFEEYYTSPEVIRAIEQTDQDGKELLRVLIQYGACLPTTSTCFKKSFFEKFGAFDENYALVEDYPTHVRLAKENWIIHYANFVAIKHRSGGISHGQKGTLSRSARMYLTDTKHMLEELLLSNVEILPAVERKRVVRERSAELTWINSQLMGEDAGSARTVSGLWQRASANIMKHLETAYWWIRTIQLKLLYITLLSFILMPVLALMLETVFNISAEILMEYLVIVPYSLLGIYIIFLLIWLINYAVVRVSKFPDRSLIIGK